MIIPDIKMKKYKEPSYKWVLTGCVKTHDKLYTCRYHECFCCRMQFNVQETNTYDLGYKEGPGFWYTFDKDDNIIRCGISRTINKKIKEFIPISEEYGIGVDISYWSDKMGFRQMKEFKQNFKRALKKNI